MPQFDHPGVPPPASRRRIWLHAALFAVTSCTVTFAGSFWEGAFDRVESLGGLLGLVIARPEVLIAGVPFALCLLAILGSHEMGHYLACRRHGIPASLPFFLPGPPPFGTFGALIRIRGVIPTRNALFDVAAAGPLAGFAVALPILIAGILRAQPVTGPAPPGTLELGSPLLSALLERALFGEADLAVGSIYIAGWFGLLVTSMNLFPVGQLDGGHAIYALSARAHRPLAWITILGLAVLTVVQAARFRTVPAYTLWCVVLLILRDRHPRLADEVSPLDLTRTLGVFLLMLLFLACFIPLPMSF